jgi:hypothetical protein
MNIKTRIKELAAKSVREFGSGSFNRLYRVGRAQHKIWQQELNNRIFPELDNYWAKEIPWISPHEKRRRALSLTTLKMYHKHRASQLRAGPDAALNMPGWMGQKPSSWKT